MKRAWLHGWIGPLALTLVGAFAGYALAQQEAAPEGRAELIDRNGDPVGEATFTTTEDGAVRVRVQIAGFADAGVGERGMHFHENATCDPPDFESAGGHFDPADAEHGLLNPDGPHAGDLPNIRFDEQGDADYEVLTMLVTLDDGERSLFADGGTVLVIHEGPDDYVQGGSGDRIACGEVEAEPAGEAAEAAPNETEDATVELPREWVGEENFTTETLHTSGEWEIVFGAWCYDGVSFARATAFDQDGVEVGEVTVIGEGVQTLVLDAEPGEYYLEVWSPDMHAYRWELAARPVVEAD